MPVWTVAAPVAAAGGLAAAARFGLTPAITALCVAGLVATVFSAVHHAETVAHKVGEPFGTLVLAVAVTVIEVGLVVSVMLGGGADKATLARDTVFAAVMLVTNGVVGLCLLIGGVQHGEQGFQVQGASGALAVLAALTVLTLIVPNFTHTVEGPVFSPQQLAFAGTVSLVLYGTFVFVQTVRHRADFTAAGPDHPGAPPSAAASLVAAGLLLLSLAVVVGLAKALSPALEGAVAALGAPKATVGIVIAAVVLLPESITAIRAARAARLQPRLNLALGSALASIGLTIPAVSAVSLATGRELVLGLDQKDEVLLVLTLFTGVVTLGTGRTTVLQGAVHLTIAAVFLFLAAVP